MIHAFVCKYDSNGACTCGSSVTRHDGYDAYYCAATGEWLSPHCECPEDDEDCPVIAFEQVHGPRPERVTVL